MEEKSLESLLKDASYFYNVCTKVFIQHAPRKKRHICGNNKQFMNNILFNVIVLRKKFRYKLLKSLTEPNKYSDKKQRNWCVYQEIYIYIYIYIFVNLSEKNITDNNENWQSIEPFFSEKTKSKGKITLIENKRWFQ